jgi:PAS domain S-box-containing protein
MRSPSTDWKRHLPPLGVAALVLLATMFASWTAYSVYATRDRERFERRVEEIAEAIETRLETYVVLLQAANALFAGRSFADLARFRTFVETLDLPARYPGLDGLGVVARVPAANRAVFEDQIRSATGTSWVIRSDQIQAEYGPVVALEPLDERSKKVIGVDLGADPEQRAAMERARDSGLPAVSHRAASDELDVLEGPIVFLPIYASGAVPDGVAARRHAHTGFVFGPLDTDDYVRASLSRPDDGQVAFAITDAASGSPLFESDGFVSASGDAAADEPSYVARRKINLGGRDWNVAFHTTPRFDELSRMHLLPYLLGGGVLISLLLFVAMRAQADARHEAERNASVLQALLLARRESEARRAAILESSLDAVVAMDEAGRITEFNRAAEQAFGYTRAEVLGKDLFDTIIPTSYREPLRRGFERYLHEGGESFLGRRVEATARRRDDREFAVEVTVSEIRLDSGREFTAHVRDITERKQYEETLRLERESVETLHRITSSFAAKLDLQALAQDVVDAATDCTSAEAGAFFYSGPIEDGAGESIHAVSGAAGEDVEPSELPHATALLGPVLNGRAVVRIDDVTTDPRYPGDEALFGHTAGREAMRSLLAVPVITGSGTMLGTILLGHSQPGRFTERNESVVLAVAAQAAVSLDKAALYRAAQEARQAAELANRTKDEFLATLSHELRTPLTAILGWCQLLTRGKRTEAEIARGLERIESSAQAQTRLISDLLDVSRIVSGKLRLEVQPLDLEPVIEAAIEGIRPAAEAKNIRVRSSVDPAAVVVAGDSNRLQQVFWNLLSNAVKFTPKNGSIEVVLEHRGSQAVVRVTDDGCGIRPQDLACIFDRFRQVDSSTTRRSGGLGLGLAIVRHLVELHGGTVRAESEGENRGSSFYVTLPVLPSRTHGDARAVDGDGHRAPMPALEQPLAGLRVLVVDDDLETRELIKTILEEGGANVCAVPSVNQAVEALDAHGPDVLVSDIAMPERDGYELIRYVRSLGESQGGKVPALALTAFARTEDRSRALLAGFQMHAAKPVEPSELIAMVASLARRPSEASVRWH